MPAVFVDQIEISLKLTKAYFLINFFKGCSFSYNEHIYLIKPHFASTTYSTHFLKAEQALTTLPRGILLNTLVISVTRDCAVL